MIIFIGVSAGFRGEPHRQIPWIALARVSAN